MSGIPAANGTSKKTEGSPTRPPHRSSAAWASGPSMSASLANPGRTRAPFFGPLTSSGCATVIIDTGAAHAWHRHGDQRILVTRTCYLALRRAVSQHPPTHIVAIDEPGRAIRLDDITAILGVPVATTIRHDPAIARTIDAGLLTSQLPRQLARGLRHLLDTTTTPEVTR
mgnify:CR=1 FL=1